MAEKSVNGVVTKYVWEGDKMVAEIPGSSVAKYFYYDASGQISQMERGTFKFSFLKNAQGDVVGMQSAGVLNEVTSSGLCAQYAYDAWGNHIYVTYGNGTAATANTPPGLNPFRYRGYYYDTDSGMYYLQNRWYVPEWGRFLNADAFVTTKVTGLLNANMYAYCENDPVNRIDSNGMFSIAQFYLTTTIVSPHAAAASAKKSAFKEYIHKKIDEAATKNNWTISPAERDSAVDDPFGAYWAYQSASVAEMYTLMKFPDNAKSDSTAANAFRHAMLNAVMAYSMGEKGAEKWANLHESVALTMPQYVADSNMDLANNAKGREVGMKYRGVVRHPNAAAAAGITFQMMADEIYDGVMAGEYTVLIGG